MKTISILFACVATLATSSGCSKAESSTEDNRIQVPPKATMANPAIKRPRWYYPDEDGIDAKSDVLTLSEELASNFAPGVSAEVTFDGFESFFMNGYSFTFCTYTAKGSSNLPRKFAGLIGIVEEDTNGIPYITCPVTPGPSGTFAIPDSINSIPVIFVSNNAFNGCSAMEHVILPDTIQYIGADAFYNCSGLLDLSIPESVQEIDDKAFWGCSSLKSVRINSDPSDFRIGKEAFANCNSIEDLLLPQGDFYIDVGAFDNAFATNAFPEELICLGNRYWGITKTNLTRVVVSNGCQVAKSFYENLKQLNEPFSLYVDSGKVDEYGETYIPYNAYKGLTNLYSVIVGPHIKWISGDAFAECPNLTNLVIQGDLKLVGRNAFINSKNLSIDSFPFGKNVRNALLAFHPAALRSAINRCSDSLSRLRLYCGLVLAINTLKDRKEWNSIDETRNDWEQSMQWLHSAFGGQYIKPSDLSSEEIAIVCETIEIIDKDGRDFRFSCPPPKTVFDPKSMTFVEQKPLPFEYQREQRYEHLRDQLIKDFSVVFQHPCTQFRLAQMLAEENQNIKAVELFKKAAIGFASGLCPRVADPDNFKASPFEDMENAISECIQAIDSLGYQTLAEVLLLQTQMIRSQQKNPQDLSSTLSYGTAWFINDNTVVSCHHVIEDSKEIWMETEDGSRVDFTILAEDPTNDIAIMKAEGTVPNHSTLPLSSKLGSIASKIFTVGYPLPDIMGSEKKYNEGSISALSGIGNDNRFYQISIPIQPGNSGGAVVSEDGLVIGLASAALDAEKVFKLTGSIPQNVNYAIKSRYITALLQDNGIPYDETPSKSGTDMKAFVDQVSRATILLQAR